MDSGSWLLESLEQYVWVVAPWPSGRYLEDNLDDWLSEQLEDYIEDDYLIFDCPG